MPSDTTDTHGTSDSSDSPDDRADATALSRRRLLGAAGATAATAAVAGCSTPFVQIRTASTTVEHRFDADDLLRLRVEDATDEVAIERTGGDTVRVRVHKRAHGSTDLDDLELRSSVEDGTLSLGTRKPDVAGIGGGSVDLEVSVPDSVAVDRVRTSDGSVALRSVSGDPTTETHDGDVAVSGLAGDIEAATDDGEVVVDGADGVVTARTRDGDLVVRDPGAVGDLSTDDGDLVAEVPAVDGDATIRSRDGDVTVSLGDAVDAVVEATTHDGDVLVAGSLDGVGTLTDTRVAATTGDGTNRLEVHTDDGDVIIERL